MLTLQPYIEEIFNHLRAEPFKKFLERYVVDEKKDPMSLLPAPHSAFLFEILLRNTVLYFFQREVHAILSMEKLRIEHAGTIKNCLCDA